jgi:hypothetical protein
MSRGQYYDQVVSLGRACQPAHQIRRVLQISAAHIFDWIVTTDHGVATLIASDLDGFFDRGGLIMGPEGCIIDRVTQTQFLHEFPTGSDVETQHHAHQERFVMLAERWRTLLASPQAVLFVRQHGWDAAARASAVRLRDTIRRRAPRLRFAVLYLTADATEHWGETQILNRHLPQPSPYDWRGDDAAWERLLGEALAAAPPS